MTRKPRSTALARSASSPGDRAAWGRRFTRNVLLALLPLALVWTLLTPFYNRFLEVSAQRLLRLSEWPAVSQLVPKDSHVVLVLRADVPAAKGFLYRIRVTDIHFNLVMLAAFFAAVPGIPWRRRLESFGWAFVIAVVFHVVSLFLYVKFAYATQLGQWSLDHYPHWKREVWGMAKHVFDLPLKFSLPLVLWAAFYFRELLGDRESRASAG